MKRATRRTVNVLAALWCSPVPSRFLVARRHMRRCQRRWVILPLPTLAVWWTVSLRNPVAVTSVVPISTIAIPAMVSGSVFSGRSC